MIDFFAASCANLVSLSFGMIPTFYSLNYVYPGSYSLVFCKMQGYFTHTSLQMTRFYLLLACFDRYAVSSQNIYIRKFGTLTVVHRIIPIVIIFCYLIAIHMIIFLDIVGNSCGLFHVSASTYNSIYVIVTISILIPVSMFTIALLIFYNLKKRQKQRQNLQLTVPNRDVIRDKKVLFVLLTKLLLYFISTVLYAPNAIYVAITQNAVKSTDRQTIESFINSLAVNFIYIYPGLSFFAFTLSSYEFRKELLKLLHLSRFQRPQRMRIAPLNSAANQTMTPTNPDSDRIF